MPRRTAAFALFAAIALTAALAAPAAAQQLVPRRDLSYALALGIASGAIDACKALGLTATAVVVVDRAGDTIVAARDDNARPHAMEAARRKAYTARTFGVTTTEFSKEKAHFIALFTSPYDLLKRTPTFWESYVQLKLNRDFGGLYRFLNDPYPDGPNQYMERIEANMERIRAQLSPNTTTFFPKRTTDAAQTQ